MITDEQVQDAFDYLNGQADNAAKARAERLYLDDYTKVVKAELMGQSGSDKLGEQERFAYSHAAYKAHLDVLRMAIAKDEKHRFVLNAKTALLDAWRTEQASNRAMGNFR